MGIGPALDTSHQYRQPEVGRMTYPMKVVIGVKAHYSARSSMGQRPLKAIAIAALSNLRIKSNFITAILLHASFVPSHCDLVRQQASIAC
jgi:hypothetical protein